MSENVMIKNGSDFSMKDVYEYLSGYETKLRNKITVLVDDGKYYDTIIVNNKKQ